MSVNRLRTLDADVCEERAKSIRNPGAFKGFAVIVAGDVHACGSDVVDSRELYLGHADIIHPVVLEKGVPAPPEFNRRLKQMAHRARYFPDPDPDTDGWSDGDLSSEAEVTSATTRDKDSWTND